MPHTSAFILIGAGLLLVNLLTFAAWGDDKRRAVMRQRRTPERQLLILCALGGWPAALLAASAYRHKTRKTAFLIPLWTIAAAHIIFALAAFGLLRAW